MTIRNELLDELLRNYKNPKDLIGEKGILRTFLYLVTSR
jgi:hypothetical protein